MKRGLVVIGASAGGIEALRRLVVGLPSGFETAILVVVHIPAHAKSALPLILGRDCALEVAHATQDDVLRPGRILVAPPDHHMIVDGDHVRLTRGPRENAHRPAIDPLFRSAARSWGPRLIGVVLSGALDDGTAGMMAIAMRGGTTVVQAPGDAAYASMPRSVMQHVEVEHVVPASAMAPLLVSLVAEELADPREGEPGRDPLLAAELGAGDLPEESERVEREGVASGLTCPACHGGLWEVIAGKLTTYRCRVGHAFSPRSLMAMQAEGVEEAMWAAYRALQESASLAKRLRDRMQEQGFVASANRYDEDVAASLARARLVRRALEASSGSADTEPST